jgi:hypothetical protein
MTSRLSLTNPFHIHFFTAVLLYCAGVPGLEPRLTEPESAGLPITPYPTMSPIRIELRSFRTHEQRARQKFT